ncbi:MAG: lactate utilization protein [Clostridiaceae bacterium]|nr:lactate utilization protein [Clostridiaceae bacterium]
MGKNGIRCEYVKNREELITALTHEIPEKSWVAAGSSETLDQLGIRSWLHEENFYYLDCSDKADDRRRNIISSFQSDIYLSSVAAVTEQGELFLVDGTGNRVAAFAYGPEKVIVIASVKKIVPDMEAAVQRLKTVAAPLCAGKRKKFELPCYKKGNCYNCHLERRMCCYYLTVGYVREKGRFLVYLIDEDLGF